MVDDQILSDEVQLPPDSSLDESDEVGTAPETDHDLYGEDDDGDELVLDEDPEEWN